MSELRECPFCGGEASIADNDHGYYGGCQHVAPKGERDCLGCDLLYAYATEAEAQEAWNTRASDARVEQLQAEVNRLNNVIAERDWEISQLKSKYSGES